MSYGGPPQGNYYGGPPPPHQGGPPPGQYPPQGHSPYPPQQGGYGPPQGHSPYPPQGQGYGPPPPQGGYNQGPPQGYPPQHQQYPPQGQYNQGPPPPGQYGQGPPQGQYGQGPPPAQFNQGPPHQQGYGQPPQGQHGPPGQFGGGPPAQPSPGYVPGAMAPGDAGADADALRKAMKGFGTDETVLLRILAKPDPLQMALLRHSYSHRLGRDLEKDVASETSGHFEDGLVALIRGPLMSDVHSLRKSMKGPGTNEVVMNDVLLSRSNADMAAIKKAYYDTYHHSVDADVKGDLSMKTERHFSMVLAANRAEESAPVYPQSIDQDVSEVYKATEGKIGTDQMTVCNIMSTRSDAQIRAIAHSFEQKYHIPLEKVIEKEFSGHMESALLMQLRGGTDRAMRDAMLLEDTMSGAGTKDSLLIQRVVRLHWNRQHMDQVKKAYKHRYHKELASRVKGEVKGDVERLLLAVLA